MPDDDEAKDELGVWLVTGGDCVAAGGLAALRLRLVTPGEHEDPAASADKPSIALFLTSETATEIAHHLLAAAATLPSDRRKPH